MALHQAGVDRAVIALLIHDLQRKGPSISEAARWTGSTGRRCCGSTPQRGLAAPAYGRRTPRRAADLVVRKVGASFGQGQVRVFRPTAIAAGDAKRFTCYMQSSGHRGRLRERTGRVRSPGVTPTPTDRI